MKNTIKKRLISLSYKLLAFAILIIIIIIIDKSVNIINQFELLSLWLYPNNPDGNGELFKICLSFLGGLGILFGLYVSYRRAKAMEQGVLRQKESIDLQNKQISITRKAQTDERFKNAVEHLGDTKEPIILGGVAELNQIAKENRTEYSEIIFNILCSYIRSNANIIKNSAEEINSTVVQTIINNLFKSNDQTYLGYKANLRFANLNEINLDGILFYEADLSFCYMPSIKNTIFEDSNLDKTEFILSELIDIDFPGSKLHQSLFHGAYLINVKMDEETELLSTSFLESTLINVNFDNNSVGSCNFIASKIDNCSFNNSSIVSASFAASGLKSIDFSSVKLFGTNDFRASGFLNVNLNTIVTSTNFSGCSYGDGYIHRFKDKLIDGVGKMADFKGITTLEINKKTNTALKLTEKDVNEIHQEYDNILDKKTKPNYKNK